MAGCSACWALNAGTGASPRGASFGSAPIKVFNVVDAECSVHLWNHLHASPELLPNCRRGGEPNQRAMELQMQHSSTTAVTAPAGPPASCGPQDGCEGGGGGEGLPRGPPKPFFGGYRNTRTGVVHHHASTQTLSPQLEQQRRCAQVCSEVQTVDQKTRSAQTKADASTQCPRPGWYEDASSDRVLLPTGKHESAAQLEERKVASALTIQRHVRGWLARQRVADVQQTKQALEEFVAAQGAQRAQREEEYRQAEIRRRMQPRTAADFAILHGELAAWWGQEAARIKGADADEDAKQEALRLLLTKETKLLQTIDKLKIAAAAPNKAARTENVLQRLAAPKQWSLTNGKLVAVQTPGTLRSAELAGVYRNLVAADGSSTDARLSALMHVKQALKGCDATLGMAGEVVQLADREIDLLNRGRSPDGMEGLRLRIANCFLKVLRSPQFNHEAASLATVSSSKAQQYKFTHHNAEYVQERRVPVGIQTA